MNAYETHSEHLPTRAGDMDALAIFDRDQRRRGLREGTILKRNMDARQLDAWMQAHGGGILNATRDDIEAWLDSKGRITAKTRATLVSSVSAFYEAMCHEGILVDNPAHNVVRPKVRPGLPRPIADDDLKDALRMAPPLERCILTLAAYGGLRCQEIANLRVADVLWADGKIYVSPEGAKGGRPRMIPMHEQVAASLRSYGLPTKGFVLRNTQGGRLTPAQVSRKAAAYLRSSGADATLHQLRHWCGTWACRTSGVRVTQQLLGHASLSTTAIYTQVAADDLRGAVAALPAL